MEEKKRKIPELVKLVLAVITICIIYVIAHPICNSIFKRETLADSTSSVDDDFCTNGVWQNLLGGGKEGFWEDFQGIFQTESEELFRFLNSSPMPEQPEELRRKVCENVSGVLPLL